jgi:hypothetical protein
MALTLLWVRFGQGFKMSLKGCKNKLKKKG